MRAVVLTVAAAVLALMACGKQLTVADLEGWFTASPNPVVAREYCTLTYRLANNNLTHAVILDSLDCGRNNDMRHKVETVPAGDSKVVLELRGWYTNPYNKPYPLVLVYRPVFYTSVGVVLGDDYTVEVLENPDSLMANCRPGTDTRPTPEYDIER